MKEKFLIVDDAAANRVLLKDLLMTDFDIDIDGAENGNDALELAKTKKYDIVFMDIRMPGIDGYETAKELRKLPLNLNALIIFITAHDIFEQQSQRAFDVGGIDYISKPIDHIELIRKIHLYLRFIRKENEFIGTLLEINKRLENEINTRRRIEVKLIKTQENFKNIVGKSNAAILIIDGEGVLRFINKAGETIFGRSESELLGEPIGLVADYEIKSEISIIKRSGEIGTGEITTTRTQWENKPAWLVLINDITEHKKLEENLKKAKERAQESDRLKSAFLSNMSHEIRTPMNAILGFLNFIEAEEDPVKRKEYTDIIRNSGDHLLNLINDIIDISKIEAGQFRMKIASCSIDQLFLDLYEFFNSNGKVVDEIIRLKLDIPVKQDELVIETDKSRLNQVLINLIGNALKFTTKGYVRFGYRKKENELEFFVEDTGMGIPEDKTDKIFQRFMQIEGPKSAVSEGTGLGLAISKSIVELLGGKIWLTSELEKGTTFTFTIPYHSVEKKPNKTEIEKEKINNSSLHLEDKKVLIVDDIELNYNILTALLSKRGINTAWAQNGKEAIEMCKEQMFDLVLMDIKMPIMDGLEATASIRDFNKDLPIIAQTAYALENEKELCFKAGCNDYVSKPINYKMLMELMEKYLVFSKCETNSVERN